MKYFLSVIVILVYSLSSSGEFSRKETTGPYRLQRGDTVAVIAPANSLTRYDIERFESGIAALEEQGLKVIYREDIRERVYGALAGKDHVRAEEFMQMITNPDVKAIFTIAGGYGSMRILNHIDWDAVKQNPKIFAGFSDNTALHFAINKKTGLPSIHSTGIIFLWGNTDNRPYAFRHLQALILSDPDKNIDLKDWGACKKNSVHPIEVQTFRAGTAEGTLIGGNLSLVSSLIGTPYEPDWNDKILFLEEVGEPLYKVDRMLMQLKLAGTLEKINGLILGRFIRIEAYDEKPDYTLHVVFNDIMGEYDYPVIYDFPAGHIADNLPLPIGTRVRISSDSPHLSILEDPFPLP